LTAVTLSTVPSISRAASLPVAFAITTGFNGESNLEILRSAESLLQDKVRSLCGSNQRQEIHNLQLTIISAKSFVNPEGFLSGDNLPKMQHIGVQLLNYPILDIKGTVSCK
jgi:hypothetical protein